MCGGGLFLNFLREQLGACNLNIDSQPEGTLGGGEGSWWKGKKRARRGLARGSLFSYFKALSS